MAGLQVVDRLEDVVAGLFGIVIRIGFVVDRSAVSNCAGLIEHDHMRRGFESVGFSDFAFGVVHHRGRLDFLAR